jgi:hypothetical protein
MPISHCRACPNSSLISILNLGRQYMTGVFPKSRSDIVKQGLLELVRCSKCGLVQLSESFNLTELYGINYGYRSGLNESMLNHLQNKVKDLESICPIFAGDTVVDIGGNDGSLLAAFKTKGVKRISIDPVALKFKKYYEESIHIMPDFFSASKFKNKFGSIKPKIIVSISMFYDLENPNDFIADIVEILDKEGIWHLEQSYLPAMLKSNSYDTICHEHLEYYSLRVLKNLFEAHNLKIIDAVINFVNGGSIALSVAHEDSNFKVNQRNVNQILEQENQMELDTMKPFTEFQTRVFENKARLINLISSLNLMGKTVAGYGASTKGNVLLQFCGFTKNDISCIAEVNQDKYGAYTPGTLIPILPESQVLAMKPDYLLVLPWHFKDSIIKKQKKYLSTGGKIIFPLPEIEII